MKKVYFQIVLGLGCYIYCVYNTDVYLVDKKGYHKIPGYHWDVFGIFVLSGKMTNGTCFQYNTEDSPLDINESKRETLTPIQEFYQGKNVFITGASGFLGKLIVEKLLWSCPRIGNIYVLMREKKGKAIQTRIDELIDSQAFHRVRRDVPGYKGKIRAISGDCSCPGLGISEDDWDLLVKEVNIIFHVAATVRFNDPLPYAMAVNVRATMDIVKLANQMHKLDSFIHVSTAFANCYTTDLEERFYPTPVDAEKLLSFVNTSDNDIIEHITPKLLNKWPNTYTYTKCLAEDYIRKNTSRLPVGVFRPSIVISAFSEPSPGWVDNWYGLSGFIIAVALGFCRVTLIDKDGIPNVVPVDWCVNGLIAAAWDVAAKHSQHQNKLITDEKSKSEDPEIYNFVMADKKITWNEFYNSACQYGEKYPPLQALWYKCFYTQSSETIYKIQKFILHTIPAYVADGVCLCIGKKMMFRAMYNKLHQMMDSVTFFSLKNWNFKNDNMPQLISRMSKADRKLYSCDMRNMKWDDFFQTYFLGTRRYLMKDDDSTIPEARKKLFRLHIMHRILQLVLLYVLFMMLYRAYTFFTNTSSALAN